MIFAFILSFVLLSYQIILADKVKLEEIIVTTIRTEKPKNDVFYSAQVITQEDIKTFTEENLFDIAYEYDQYYPMPERTIIGGIKWKF
jgi:outer membrane cobalamin receptor